MTVGDRLRVGRVVELGWKRRQSPRALRIRGGGDRPGVTLSQLVQVTVAVGVGRSFAVAELKA